MLGSKTERGLNLVLTLASGDKLFEDPCFWVYVKSLSKVKNADFVILSDTATEDQISRLAEYKVTVHKIEKLSFLFRDRHLAYVNYLQHARHYAYVFISDCRDVLFQKCPFEWLKIWGKQTASSVILTSEGFKMARSGFATIENFKFEQGIAESLRILPSNHWVVNGGVSLGTPTSLLNFHSMIWAAMLKVNDCTDQGVINFLMAHLQDEQYHISFPQAENFCVTGEGVKEKVVEIQLDKFGLRSNTGHYHVVHQWDRIDEFKEQILNNEKP